MNAQSKEYMLIGDTFIDADLANKIVKASGILDRFFEIAGSENVAEIRFDMISDTECVMTTEFAGETITVEVDAVPEEKDEEQHWSEKDLSTNAFFRAVMSADESEESLSFHAAVEKIAEAVEALGGSEKIERTFDGLGGLVGIAKIVEAITGEVFKIPSAKDDRKAKPEGDRTIEPGAPVTMKPERDRRIIEEVKGDKVVFTNIPKNENFDAGMAYFGGQKTGRFSFEVPKENLDLARRAVRSILGMNTWSHVRAPYGNKAELVENRS